MWRCLSLGAVVAEPVGKIVFTPLPILFHGVKRSIFGIIQDWLVSIDERIADMLLYRPFCRGIKIRPIIRIVFRNRVIHNSILVANSGRTPPLPMGSSWLIHLAESSPRSHLATKGFHQILNAICINSPEPAFGIRMTAKRGPIHDAAERHDNVESHLFRPANLLNACIGSQWWALSIRFHRKLSAVMTGSGLGYTQ